MKKFKKFIKPYRHLFALFLVIMAAIALVMLGAPVGAAILMVGLWQLSQFAMSKRRAVCFTAGLTPEQLKEFQDIMKEFGSYSETFKKLKEIGECEGGYAAIKSLPEVLKDEKKRVDEMHGELKKLRKQASVFQGSTGVRWVGNVPFITDDCARAMTSMLILETAKLGDNAMRRLGAIMHGEEGRKNMIALAHSYLGVEQKAGGAEGVADVPLPTIYVPQIIELVFKYGQARQYATVFPLGAGTVKLPRLQAGEDNFGFLGAGPAGMSQNVAQKEVTAALVTFTSNKAGGLIRIPTEIEEDTFIPLGQFLARYISRQFAKLEDSTMFLGDGTGTYANIVGVGKYCVNTPAYLATLAQGKTKPSDSQLQDWRNLRPLVNPAVLANMAANGQTSAAYYAHPSFEALFVTFNTIGAPLVYVRASNGQPATLDGFPIRWTGVLQPYQTTAAAGAYIGFFGDLSYWYLGERGAPRVEISREVFFATDELAMRALERIDVEAMAVDAMATLATAAQ